MIGTFLSILDIQVAQILPIKFRVNWHLGSGEEVQNSFSRWRPSWILIIRTSLAMFCSISVNWPFGSRKEVQNRWIGFGIGTILGIFYKWPRYFSSQFQVILAFRSKRRFKIDFQDDGYL